LRDFSFKTLCEIAFELGYGFVLFFHHPANSYLLIFTFAALRCSPLNRESGASICENSGAVPAAVSPFRIAETVFAKLCHCPAMPGWEGGENRMSQKTCLSTNNSSLRGKVGRDVFGYLGHVLHCCVFC